MVKILTVVLMMVLSTAAFSADIMSVKRKIAFAETKCSENPNKGIGIDPDYIEEQINSVQFCYQASDIVESCGAGSSMDNRTTGAAISLCDKLTGELNTADINLKNLMEDRCSKVCNPQTDGTICISQQAFCRLDVSKFMNSVNRKNN